MAVAVDNAFLILSRAFKNDGDLYEQWMMAIETIVFENLKECSSKKKEQDLQNSQVAAKIAEEVLELFVNNG